jgi:hypothetical protein
MLIEAEELLEWLRAEMAIAGDSWGAEGAATAYHLAIKRIRAMSAPTQESALTPGLRLIEPKELIQRLTEMNRTLSPDRMEVITDVVTLVGEMAKQPAKEVKPEGIVQKDLTPTMLDELTKMIEADERDFGSNDVWMALRSWVEYQWSLLPKRRYTFEVVMWEVDEHGKPLHKIRAGGPTEATTDYSGLDTRFDELSVQVQEVFYSGVICAGTYSSLADPTKRGDGSPVHDGA